MGYILVTTIKNEEENLPKLFQSIENQTLLPNLWFIINDGSTDNSEILINNFKSKYPDIVYTTNFKEDSRDITWKYHFLIKFGFEQAIIIATDNKINWNCIGVLDGDIIIDQKDYFELLYNYISDNNKIGVVSGLLYSYDKDEIIKEKRHSSHPTGAARLINRIAFESIGGYPHIPSADSIILQKTRTNGYCNKILPNLIVYQSRPTSSAEGVLIGLQKIAYSRYYLGHTLIYCILYTIRLLFSKKRKFAYVFCLSFIRLYFLREPRTSDITVLKYRNNYIYNRIKEKLLSK